MYVLHVFSGWACLLVLGVGGVVCLIFLWKFENLGPFYSVICLGLTDWSSGGVGVMYWMLVFFMFCGDVLPKSGMHCLLGQCHLLCQHNLLQLLWGQYLSV